MHQTRAGPGLARIAPRPRLDAARDAGTLGRVQSSPHRVFLGRDRTPLEAAAEWLARERGPDLGGLVVALPGARAGRRLTERLARLLGPAWTPPRVVTDGGLSDELLLRGVRTAGRLVRTLAWERALRALPRAALRRVAARPPETDDATGWTRLAEEVRRLFGEIAGDGLDFSAVGRALPADAGPGESARWEALDLAQQQMAAELARAGLVDPHLARLGALERGEIDDQREVVLVGVAQTGELLRRTLALLGGRVTALILAPPSEADDFDALGRIDVKAWAARDVPLALERWRIAQGPEEQAREALRSAAGWSGRFCAEEISIGIADPEVTPYLSRRLADAGIDARDAAGTPLERTPPARLLAAIAAFLRTRSFRDFASLCRHPDLEAALEPGDAEDRFDPIELLDRFQTYNLPSRIDGTWPDDTRTMEPRLASLHGSLVECLGELAREQPRPLPEWTGAVRALLERTYGGRELDPAGADRALIAALRGLGEALAEIEECPRELAPAVPAWQALERVGRSIVGRAIPPPPGRPGHPTVELLGWLELPLDDAPALILTGFQEDRIPESVHGDAWLPNGLRRRLGLLDNEVRLARDVFAATVILETRDEVVFVSGRRSVAGDPLRPSRLAFHAPEGEIPARVRHALDAVPAPRGAPSRPEGSSRRPLPRRPSASTPQRFSVTSFRTYLESPYRFYLEHVLGVETFDHDGRELDPRGFGSLAHDTLEVLFRDQALRASSDAQPIALALEAELRRLARQRLGAAPSAAVELQLDQLAWRLRQFAVHQAARAREGWTIAVAEWKPMRPSLLEVDGSAVELSGRIDRIDLHRDGRWALLDYKTSEQAKDQGARKAHRARDGTWRDLQLPLYAYLARDLAAELGATGPPQLGYAALGRDEANVRFDLIGDWDEDVLASALEAAREVVRAVRRGEFFDVARARPYEPVLAALCGQGLLMGSGAEEEEDENGEVEGA